MATDNHLAGRPGAQGHICTRRPEAGRAHKFASAEAAVEAVLEQASRERAGVA